MPESGPVASDPMWLDRTWYRVAAVVVLLLDASSCSRRTSSQREESKNDKPPLEAEAVADPPSKASSRAERAAAFVHDTDAKLRELWTKLGRAEWAKMTNITDETEAAAAAANVDVMAFETEAIGRASEFRDFDADPALARQIALLALSRTLPAPDDDAKRKELAEIASRMEGTYGKGKWCQGEGASQTCRDLGELSDVLAHGRDPAELLEVWKGWRTISVPMREDFTRFVALANEGARDTGFADVGELWRSRYDMSPEAFGREFERLWGQVEPLYEALHCHVRAELVERYGKQLVPEHGPIPAHLLGNMWAQDWSNLYPILEPFPGEASLDVTAALVAKGYTPRKMVELGESFFTSLGLDELPETFWERSMFEKPAGREVVCHASAWDVDLNNDLRIKMCIKIDHEDLVTIHHELGHNYYYNNYYELPVLFQSGAHDGFHEAIGDAIALSITPGYLQKVGLLDEISTNDKGVINKQMQDALAKVAFLPFGKLVDQWRWGVFSGEIPPDEYNAGWWSLRESVQGIAAPVPRDETTFDPGAKYHIPANTPYARYFLAHILQFQFHKALCAAAGHVGPVHACSIYGSREAGARLAAMLKLGASKPWPDALEALTGSREMDASALVEYFAPLAAYLEEQNAGRECGWSSPG